MTCSTTTYLMVLLLLLQYLEASYPKKTDEGTQTEGKKRRTKLPLRATIFSELYLFVSRKDILLLSLL